MGLIKWVRSFMYTGDPEIKKTGHLFTCGSEAVFFERFKEGENPPFDCLELTIHEAVKLRQFLNMAIAQYADKQHSSME